MRSPFDTLWLQNFRFRKLLYLTASLMLTFSLISYLCSVLHFLGHRVYSFLNLWTIVPSDPSVACISSIDFVTTSLWQELMDKHMSMDDTSYVKSDRVAVIKEMLVEGRHGFVLHDVCWHLLQAVFDPHPILLVKLFCSCKSLSIPSAKDRLCWDYFYSRLLALNGLAEDICLRLQGGTSTDSDCV